MEFSRSLRRLGAACQRQQFAVGLLLQGAGASIIRSIKWPPPCCVTPELRTKRRKITIRLYHSRPRLNSDRIVLAAQAAKIPPFFQRGQRQGQGFQYLKPYSTTASSSRAAHLDHTTTTCKTPTSHLAMADDRNILPDSFKAVHYDLSLTDLDFSSWTYNGVVTYGLVPLLITSLQKADTGPTASLATSPSLPRRSHSMLWS